MLEVRVRLGLGLGLGLELGLGLGLGDCLHGSNVLFAYFELMNNH